MTYHSTYDSADGLGAKWPWFMVLGSAFLVLGVLSIYNIIFETAIAIFYIGALMVLGGAAQLFHAMRVKRWTSSLFWILSGFLYMVAGILAFSNPHMISILLTLFLAIVLMAAGGVRAVVGFALKPLAGWSWMAASGVATVLIGVVIMIGWPADSLFMLSVFLTLDLLIQGASLVLFSLFIKNVYYDTLLEEPNL